MKILVVRRAAVEKASPGLWDRLDAGTHPDLGAYEKSLRECKPVLLTKGGEGDVLIFHVSARRRKIFYCDEVQPEVADLPLDEFRKLEESAGRTAVMLMRATDCLPRVTPHAHRCG